MDIPLSKNMENLLLMLTLIAAYVTSVEVNNKQQFPTPHKPSDPVNYPPDACQDLDDSTEWDYIVVGSGPAGAPVARRLAENKDIKVLIIEAGGDPPSATDIPATVFFKDEFTWNITVLPMNQHPAPQNIYHFGKYVGGNSVINGMMYVRGNHRDYDEWKESGCPGWGWDDIFPYFLKMENLEGDFPLGYYHSQGGPFTTTPPLVDPQTDPFKKRLVEALKNENIPFNPDINGEKQTGYGEVTVSIDSSGFRGNVAKAYLLNIPDNLKICKFAVVQKLLLTDKSVSGVEYIYNNTKRVAVGKEYILAAGPVSSPQILERSGIGQRSVLEKAGVEVVHELNGVGENLHEHAGNMGCGFFMDMNTQSASNPLTISMTSFTIFLNLTDYQHPVPDLQIAFKLIDPNSADMLLGGMGKPFKLSKDKFFLSTLPYILRQKNPGFIHIAGTNPLYSPIVDVNQYTSIEETRLAGDGCRLMRKIMADPVLSEFGAKPLVLKPCEKHEFNSDDEIMCELSYMRSLCYHLAGTTKMGPESDKMAVVDPHMRVHGIQKLRVVDLGIMPAVPRGNTEIPTIAISERAADMIKLDDGNTRRPK